MYGDGSSDFLSPTRWDETVAFLSYSCNQLINQKTRLLDYDPNTTIITYRDVFSCSAIAQLHDSCLWQHSQCIRDCEHMCPKVQGTLRINVSVVIQTNDDIPSILFAFASSAQLMTPNRLNCFSRIARLPPPVEYWHTYRSDLKSIKSESPCSRYNISQTLFPSSGIGHTNMSYMVVVCSL